MTLQEKLAVTEAEFAKVQQEKREAWRIYSEAKKELSPLEIKWFRLNRRAEHLEKSIEALKELVGSETVAPVAQELTAVNQPQ